MPGVNHAHQEADVLECLDDLQLEILHKPAKQSSKTDGIRSVKPQKYEKNTPGNKKYLRAQVSEVGRAINSTRK